MDTFLEFFVPIEDILFLVFLCSQKKVNAESVHHKMKRNTGWYFLGFQAKFGFFAG